MFRADPDQFWVHGCDEHGRHIWGRDSYVIYDTHAEAMADAPKHLHWHLTDDGMLAEDEEGRIYAILDEEQFERFEREAGVQKKPGQEGTDPPDRATS